MGFIYYHVIILLFILSSWLEYNIKGTYVLILSPSILVHDVYIHILKTTLAFNLFWSYHPSFALVANVFLPAILTLLFSLHAMPTPNPAKCQSSYVIITALTVVYILIIFIAFFVMEHHWKTSYPLGDLNLRRWSQSTDTLRTRPSYIPKRMNQAQT